MTTFLELMDGAREGANQENSNFVSATELKRIINNAGKFIWDILTDAFEDYFTDPTPTTFTLTSTGVFALPDTFYKLRGVDRDRGGGEWEEVEAFGFRRRNQRTVHGCAEVQYRLMNRSLVFTPAAEAAGDYRYWQIPQWTPLVNDGDTLHASIEPYSEFLETYAAIRMAAKEESDTAELRDWFDRIKARIATAKMNRDMTQAQVIEDVRPRDSYRYGRRLF